MIAPSTVAERLDGLTKPVRLIDWWLIYAPSNNLVIGQCGFVFNELASLLVTTHPTGARWGEVIESVSYVVSTHTSKSVRLPVFRLVHPGGGLELVMRNNFYNWQVSVISSEPIKDNFHGLFVPTRTIDAVYCEGFDPSWVFGSYENDQRRFTVTLGGDHTLFTFLWLLTRGREN